MTPPLSGDEIEELAEVLRAYQQAVAEDDSQAEDRARASIADTALCYLPAIIEELRARRDERAALVPKAKKDLKNEPA